MSLTEEQEQELCAKWEQEEEQGSPLDRLRAYTMARGVAGIRNISRVFKRLDQNGDKRLDFAEFEEALQDYGIEADAATRRECFDDMDIEGNGVVNFDEFLIALRPPLSEERLDLINQAFDKMDRLGTGQITVEDLQGVYSAEYHPKFQDGTWTEDEVFQHWLKQFGGADEDGTVSRDDFINYYVGVSSSIDDDEYFVEMMKSAWKLD